jgi:ABC-type transporter Mla MlaB component
MSKTSARPNIWGKLVRFVRPPHGQERDSSYVSQSSSITEQLAGTAVFDRTLQRRKDEAAVRKREFDTLRKLQQRQGIRVSRKTRGQSSPNFAERHVTLGKIAHIEREISNQWWSSESTTSSRMALDAHQASDARDDPDTVDMSETVPLDDPAAAVHLENLSVMSDDFLDSALVIAPSKMAAEPAGSMHRGPDQTLEAAALSFAMADFAKAESYLLVALDEGGPFHVHARERALTLLDFYRITAQRSRFEDFAIDFVHQFGESAPEWGSSNNAADGAVAVAGTAVAVAETDPQNGIWRCPDVLDAAAAQDLGQAMVRAQSISRINWSDVQSIAMDAVGSLERVLAGWCQQSVRLEFVGADQLLRVLHDHAEHPEEGANNGVWQLLFKFLQIMRRHAEFEQVSMHYCVQFEESPPPWQDAACILENRRTHSTNAQLEAEAAGYAAPLDGASTLDTAVLVARLHGEITDDATHAFAGFHGGAQAWEPLRIHCADLVRVDFSAAGSILNWVMEQQSQGVRVQFVGVHRLIAALFHVVGVTQFAVVDVRR